MKNIKNIGLLLSAALLWASCKEDRQLQYNDPNAPAPAPVTNVSYQARPGAAVLTFKAPADENLLYVRAEYEVAPGQVVEAKSGKYKDTLLLEGFNDTQKHSVKVYAVGKNEKASEPVTLEVTPLTPPYRTAFSKLTLKETFGGAAVTFENPDAAKLAYVLIRDSTGNGEWQEASTFYSAAMKGSFAARGYDTVSQKFAVYVRDRWGHKSDTLRVTLKPLYEVQIDRLAFKEINFPTDTYSGHIWSGITTVRAMSFLWNNTWNNDNDCFHTKPAEPKMPQWFTMDLGAVTALSRFKLFHRKGTSGAYVGGDPKRYEVWGSNAPDGDGGWNNWTMLGTFESTKPSGPGVVSTDDVNFAVVNGEDFDFPIGIPPVRYLRIKTLETWGGFQYIYISELQFWGAKQ